ncbi:MAG TPA: asparagine synthase (glutamine-hydrolyzing) [Steroidobacteraceae bacterium]|jgi:asparagine synthase (glutamine-hydrolysing)|nr:asparagine synthase (glutamine-hydrolyzing) [Steroidobacteraceae bacterium]
MCGITGYQGSFAESLLEAMTAAVAHRGPDGGGGVVLQVAGSPPTALGHRRLAIIDLSAAGQQPMTADPDPGGAMRSGLTLTFNGEIYNYRELRAELAAQGHRFRTATDSEVLLHLYERDGLGMLGRLNGIFAFAIHDGREGGRPEGVERGALFLARDPLGVKPLYYAETGRGFLFASEIKALLCERSLARTIDPVALHEMLAYLWTPAPRTMLASVRKLEPGAALIVAGGRVRRAWNYYHPPCEGAALDRRPARQIAAELSERVATAVTRQLVADVPVGAFLSGGLDSSAIVAMMRRARPGERIHCFCAASGAASDDGFPSDLPYARRVAQLLDLDLHEITITPGAIDRLEEMVVLLDEPQADPAPINALLISERARSMGIPVLLSGAGGDDILGGYRRLWALAFERYWGWLPRPLRRALQTVAGAAAAGAAFGQAGSNLRRLTKMFAYAAEDPERRLVSYFWWSTAQLRRSLYSRDFAQTVAGRDEAQPLLESLRRLPADSDALQRMLYLETRHFLADHNLNYTDRAGMATGVEIRVPLLDVELVDFAAHIPSALKQRGRTGKAIFKQAMEPILPREVIYRSKVGFGAPLRRWLRHELRARVDDTLGEESLRRRGFFDPRAVRRLVELDRSGRIAAGYTIFALMCFELWCRHFVDA